MDNHGTTMIGDLLMPDTKSIKDENENEQLVFNTTTSAVNQLSITNAASGTGPILEAEGDDTNIDLKLVPKGTGGVNLEDALLKRPQFKDYSETAKTVTSTTGTLILDLEEGNVFIYELTEEITTFTISNWLASTSQSFTLFLTQHATPVAMDWTDESVLWAGGTAPDITTASSVHVITFSSPNGGTTILGFHAGSEMAVPA